MARVAKAKRAREMILMVNLAITLHVVWSQQKLLAQVRRARSKHFAFHFLLKGLGGVLSPHLPGPNNKTRTIEVTRWSDLA